MQTCLGMTGEFSVKLKERTKKTEMGKKGDGKSETVKTDSPVALGWRRILPPAFWR